MATKINTRILFLISALIPIAYPRQDCINSTTGKRQSCVIIQQCPGAEQKLKYGIKVELCGFTKATPWVCCEEQDDLPQPSLLLPDIGEDTFIFDRPTAPPISKRKSDEVCGEYSKLTHNTVSYLPLLPQSSASKLNVSSCEYDSVELVVGGSPAGPREFPFMAALAYEVDGDLDYKCGGTLISDRFVVTAAHCIRTLIGPPLYVRLGDLDLAINTDDAAPQNIPVLETIVHPGYKPPKHYNDIALLRLRTRVSFSRYVKPACLWTKDKVPKNVRNTVIGWGLTSYGGDKSSALLKAELKVFDNRACAKVFANHPQVPSGIVDTMLCAGDPQGVKDTCQGDSGGPLLIPKKNDNCLFYVAGITSFGKACGIKGVPAVYTKVSKFVPWIEKIVWP